MSHRTQSSIQLGIALCAFVMAAQAPASACSCLIAPSLEDAVKTSDAVLIVRVERKGPPRGAGRIDFRRPYMDVRVVRRIRGTETRQAVRVWGGSATDCIEKLGPFAVGTS